MAERPNAPDCKSVKPGVRIPPSAPAMQIDIPTQTPLGKKVTTIGIWMSGGADSSLLCYLLAEKIIKEKLPVKIQPITVDYKRPFAYKAVSIRILIEHLLNAKNIFNEHTVYHPPENTIWTPKELAEQFHIRNYENFKNNKFQVLYSGITTNPPVEDQKTFKWGILTDVESKRSANIKKETIRYFEKDGGEFFEIKPFFNVNKKALAHIYKEKNLLSTLFPLTRSCEKIGTVHGHCGDCWWCDERKWAFGTL